MLVYGSGKEIGALRGIDSYNAIWICIITLVDRGGGGQIPFRRSDGLGVGSDPRIFAKFCESAITKL